MKIFIWTTVLVVAAVIVWAFWTVGSPQTQRMRNFDQMRVSDLGNIQREIGEYYRLKAKLPDNLAALTGAYGGATVPQDPENKTAYEYAVTGATSFRLCATFGLASMPGDDTATYYGGYGYFGTSSFEHGAGRQCFERTLDPDYFKPQGGAPVPAPLKD